MAARAYWQGQIRLALVSIPVEIYSATKSGAQVSFHQIHEPSGKRIKYEKVVPGVGPVDATFGKVTVYATEGNRLAVGVEATVKAQSGSLGTTRGEIWLTALPWNEPDSQLVRARDVRFATKTDSAVVNMLTALFENAAVRASIESALTHDFAPDYREVVAKAQAAIGSRREGDFLLSAKITKVGNGRIEATGDGLFLPVRAEGEAQIAYRPQ